MPTQKSKSESGKPASSVVGTLGSAAARLTLDTASASSLPSRMNSIAGGAGAKYTSTRPAKTSVRASGAPRNGTS